MRNRRNKSKSIIVLLVVALVCITLPARAGMQEYDFVAVTANPIDASLSDLQAQFSVVVTTDDYDYDGSVLEVDPGQVAFIFSNTGSIDSSIREIYIDDGVLTAPPEVVVLTQTDGMSFFQPVTPAQLMGSPIGFVANAAFSVDSPSSGAVGDMGINPGESVALVFDTTATFDEIIAKITEGFDTMYTADTSTDLAIGIHVARIPYGETTNSNSFVAMNPLPATLLLGILGLGVGGWKLRKTLE